MLVGGDLGFSSLLVVVVLLFAQVIATIVVRRKWRLEVAKREDVQRLLALASEETARAEFEAKTRYGYSYGYGYNSVPEAAAPQPVSRRVQYQCAVCLSPTTTRCARCKSVRYCSGKCQIIHWRQGHKEECHPCTNTQQIKEAGGGSSQNVTKREEYEIEVEYPQSERNKCSKLVEAHSEEPVVSSSVHSEVPEKKNEIGFECLVEEKETNSASNSSNSLFSIGISASCTPTDSSTDVSTSNSNHSDGLDRHVQANVATCKALTDGSDMVWMRKLASAEAAVGSSADITQSVDCNKIKPSSIDEDTCFGSSSSSASTVDGSRSPISQHPSPSSGFWEGTIDRTRSQNGTLDDLAKDATPFMDVACCSSKIVMSDDAHPIATGIRKPGDGLSEEISIGAIKPGKSPLLSSKTYRNMDADCNNVQALKSREVKHSASSVACAHPTASAVSCPSSNDVGKDCSSRSMGNEGSHHVINSTSSNPHPQKFREVGTLSFSVSDAHLASRNEMHSVQRGKSTVVDRVDKVATCASQLGGGLVSSRNDMKTSVWKIVDQFGASKLSPHSPLGTENETSGRYNGKELFSYELFVKLYNWNKFELRPCGLTNCGNSCYANATLQCLAFTPPLTAYLIQGFHSKACERKEWCFTCELGSLVLKAKEGNSTSSPIRMLTQIQNSGSQLGNGREEDAHEFLRYAIDTMQAICLKESGVHAPGMLEEETTLMGLTFGGYLRSKIRCMKCGGKSERHERMMDLTVEIEGDIGTLEEALHQFTDTETLDGENKYHCSRCKSYEKAKKKLMILEAPNVLTIALKRFQSGKFGKLNKSIRFPEILDIAPFICRTSDKSPIYRLYGVVVHLDIMNASFTGHYVSYVRNIQNKWFKIDDSTVKAVELGTVLEERAYMLLYARCSPRAPRLIRNAIIPRDPRKLKTSMCKPRSYQSGPCDVPIVNSLNGKTAPECFCNNHASFLPSKSALEEDSASDNSSSFFTESCSSSTGSSNRDSTSTEDNFDQTFGDLGPNWNSLRRSSSDSDSSSSSSSTSPFYSRPSQVADLDRYLSRRPDPIVSKIGDAESAMDGHGFWEKVPHKNSKLELREGKGSAPFLHSDPTKQCRKLASNHCRETNSSRLEQANPSDHPKSSVCFRRSTRERTD